MSLDEWWSADRGPRIPGGVLGSAATPGGAPGPSPDLGGAAVDLASPAYDDHLAQLGRWAKEGWDWDEIADEVCDLFDVPAHLRPRPGDRA